VVLESAATGGGMGTYLMVEKEAKSERKLKSDEEYIQ
jgi:hypothetical protein